MACSCSGDDVESDSAVVQLVSSQALVAIGPIRSGALHRDADRLLLPRTASGTNVISAHCTLSMGVYI